MMSDQQKQEVIRALQEVYKHLEAKNYAHDNVRNRMRGAHLLAMRLLDVAWPSKGEAIPQDWWKTIGTP